MKHKDERSDQKHSVYGPSGSKRWMNCPASIQMENEMEKPPEVYNFPAEEGTAAHELGEYCLTNEVQASDCIGKVFNEFEVDQEMANQTQKYIDYVDGQCTWDSTLGIEMRVHMMHIEETMFGTADAVIFSPDSIEVIDLKYGRGIVVEADNNSQLMLYAIGVLAYLYSVKDITYSPDQQVQLTIVQPRAPHKDGPIRTYTVTVSQLKDFQRLVKRAVELSKEEMPPFGPSENGCRWCRAAPVCTEYAKYNLEQLQLDFADFATPKREFGQKLIDIKSMDDTQVGNILTHTKAITTWLKTLADYAVAELTRGKPVPGFKLVYGRSIRKWSDSDKAYNILVQYGVEENRLHTTKFLTAPQMEKELRPEEWDMISDLVIKPQGKITLAPNSDGRQAVDPNIEAQEEWS